MSVANNLNAILDRIELATTQSGRAPQTVKLLAVTKTKPIETIDEAAQAAQKRFGPAQGQVSFGENYVQEAVQKIESRPNLDWHFIGPIQSNKVKDIVGKVTLIHSVDRFKIAREISKEAQKKNVVQKILLQIHVGDEETKHGFESDELTSILPEILALPNLKVRGLMALPPLSDDVSISRSYFKQVADLMKNLNSNHLKSSDPLEILSLGTTNDFEAAIFEGATHVRVGTAIFGERERRSET